MRFIDLLHHISSSTNTLRETHPWLGASVNYVGDNPHVGYISSITTIILGVIPSWLTEASSWVTFASGVIGCLIGLATLALQWMKIQDRRRHRKMHPDKEYDSDPANPSIK